MLRIPKILYPSLYLMWNPIGCPETSVTNYQYTPHNIPEERRPEIL